VASRLPVLRAILGAVLIGTIASVPGAVAQGLGPTCALTTPDEANAVFAGAGLGYNDNSSAYYCSFGGTFDLVVSLQAETSFAEHKAQFPEGGTDVTVAGLPGWWREGGGSLGVAANGSILHLNGWGSSDDSAAQLAMLSALAERIIPRVPAPADPATVATLRANVPAGADVSVVPGWSLVGSLAGLPAGQALTDLLAAQGRTPEDLALVVAMIGDGMGVVASVPGVDGAALTPALLGAIVPGIADASSSIVELSGREVTRFAVDPPFHAAASGDLVGIATGPDPFRARGNATRRRCPSRSGTLAP
jgi:hypothetical protein